jgi:glutaredoxin
MLSDRSIAFDAIYLGDELTMQGVKAASGTARVPQVFIDGKLIGGSDQLEKFLSANS